MILWQQYAGITGTGKRPEVGRLAEVSYGNKGGRTLPRRVVVEMERIN